MPKGHVKGKITTHTIAFAPSKGPSLLDRFLWEQLPLAARAMGEKELRLQITPEKPFKQWHLALRKPKPFVEAQLDKLFQRQSHFGIKAAIKERPQEGELVLLLPLAHADGFINAHNLFFHACMPFLHVHTSRVTIDFSKSESHHLLIHGAEKEVKRFTELVRRPTPLHVPKTPTKMKRMKKSMRAPKKSKSVRKTKKSTPRRGVSF